MSSSLGVARGRFLVGGFLVVAFLTVGTGTALAQIESDLSATCEGWSLTFSGFDPAWNSSVTIIIDGQVAVDGAVFASAFGPIGGDWVVFQATHYLDVWLERDGLSDIPGYRTASGCPESAPTTTPTTQAPTPTTQAPTPTQTTSSPTTAASATTSAPTTIAATTSTEATATTTTVATTETSLVAAGSDDGGGGGNTLMGVLIGLAVAAGLGGAWVLGRRNAAPAPLGDAAPPPPTDH